MMDDMNPVDDVDTEKTRLRGCVHPVHNVHSVHCLDKSNWLQLTNLGVSQFFLQASA
jgi:hypothetical protein